MNIQDNLETNELFLSYNKGRVVDLKPIEISCDLPVEQEEFACVWPSSDPMPTEGLSREFLFNCKSVTLIVKEVLLLGDGCVGVVLSNNLDGSEELMH